MEGEIFWSSGETSQGFERREGVERYHVRGVTFRQEGSRGVDGTLVMVVSRLEGDKDSG